MLGAAGDTFSLYQGAMQNQSGHLTAALSLFSNFSSQFRLRSPMREEQTILLEAQPNLIRPAHIFQLNLQYESIWI